MLESLVGKYTDCMAVLWEDMIEMDLLCARAGWASINDGAGRTECCRNSVQQIPCCRDALHTWGCAPNPSGLIAIRDKHMELCVVGRTPVWQLAISQL